MAKADSTLPPLDHTVVDEALSKILERARYAEHLLETALSKMPSTTDSMPVEAAVISAQRFISDMTCVALDLVEKNDAHKSAVGV